MRAPAVPCFTLDKNGEPVKAKSFKEWAGWFETADRIVAKTPIDGCEVSTIFLGMVAYYSPGDKPLLWETLVFYGVMDGECRRWASLSEAKEGHAEMVAAVRSAQREAKSVN